MIDIEEKYLAEIRRILGEHVSDCEVRAFGSSVDIEGDTLVVSAEKGVYVFRKEDDNWIQTAKLLQPDGPSVLFGENGKISGNTIAVHDWFGIYIY